MSEIVTKIMDEIKELKVLELNELVKAIEEEFGVSAAAMAVAAPAAGGAAADAGAEKTEFDVVMTDFGAKKLDVIKVVRELTGLGLKEAKEMVEGVPSKIKEGASKEAAEEIKTKLEGAGATVELK